MRKAIVLVSMLIIVLACVTAAMSYSAAVVQSPAVLRVASTDEALLALIPAGDLEKAGDFCRIDDGELYFNFSGGEGLTADSFWEWPHFFTVQNNSTENIKFTIKSEDIPFINLEARSPDLSPGKGIVMVEDGKNTNTYYPLLSGETACIGVSFNIGAEAVPVSENGTLAVISEAD